ncbi:hypothetical protein Roomu2_00043 [Pseudomonas phage vB_PpuM-Roomu-2]|uniref:Uncharacterized protein n=1 Tax=Pseudomonas phage vB_PpuM-Roomu-2 TaxID=3132621 RepID=A0AAX4MZY5_9CAUD
MEGFVEHKGAFWRIQGHVLMVRSSDLLSLYGVAAGYEFPHAYSEEGDYIQFAHPLNMKERDQHAWLYHRMEALNKTVDNEPTPPHNPGPQAT